MFYYLIYILNLNDIYNFNIILYFYVRNTYINK